MNLTGHRSVEGIVRRLVLDAMAMEPHLPAARHIADLGSGAGFPGLPLAVLRADCAFVLVESRERRHHFQRAAIRALGLGNVRALRGRIEQLEPETSDGIVAQALSQPSEAVRLALRWCRPGGWIAIPGAEQPPAPGQVDGIREEASLRYRVPISAIRRTLWLGRREGAVAAPA
jgi:16S rRNA (guanine527-N7)-methyltransferase